MSCRPTDVWQIHLDESGSFQKAEWPRVIAGVLRRVPPSPADDRWLRDAVLACFPGVAWPPHASHLSTAGGRMVATLAGIHAGAAATSGALPALVQASERALDQCERPFADSVRAAVAV